MKGDARKPLLTTVRILLSDRLWDGLMASKLQFIAQGTTGYVFPLKQLKADFQGPGVGHFVIFP